MDKDELFKIMREINMAYGNTKFPLSMELVDFWFKALGDRDYEQMSDAAMRFIRKSEYAPTIAGLISEYDSITDEKDETAKKLNEWWENIKSTYPRAHNDDYTLAREYYDKLTLGDPDRGNALYTKLCIDIKKAERKAIESGTGKRNMPTLEDYLAGVKTK